MKRPMLKFMIILAFGILVVLPVSNSLTSWYGTPYLSPYVNTNLLQNDMDHIHFVYFLESNQKISERKLLIEDKEEIKRLLEDLQSTWNTNLVSPPMNEKSYDILFDEDSDPEKINGMITYFPETDRIRFRLREFSTFSLTSSEELKKLMNKEQQTGKSP